MSIRDHGRAMTLDELATALDRHGGDLARWPAEARQRAEALLAGNGDAVRAVSVAGTVQAALARAAAPRPVDAAFVGRVLARVNGAQRRQRELAFTPRFAAAGATGLVLCLAVGMALGLVMPAPVSADDGQDLAVLVLGAGVDDADALTGGLL